MDDEFITVLEKFTNKYPEKTEMKLLFADKFRRLEKYTKAIKIYSEVIDNKNFSSKSSVLYSRGIAYERLNKWKRAENELELGCDHTEIARWQRKLS